jgi:hypothetical protein
MTRQYETLELTYSGPKLQDDLVHTDMKAVFQLNGRQTECMGFYAGDGIYKVRYLPLETGELRYRVSGPAEDAGTMMISGPDSMHHGPVRTSGTVFRYEDGTCYLPFGTTAYALLHQPQERIDETMETMRKSPFNKIRFCVFPKHFPFNTNEPKLFPFEKDGSGKFNVHRPCMKFWDEMEQWIRQLAAMGTEADLILFHPYDCWGFSHLCFDECLLYLDYLTRRLSAFPNVWWSLANEYDQLEDFETGWWDAFASYITEHSPVRHLLSNHDFTRPWDFDHPACTHVCLQSSDAYRIPSLLKKYGKPVVFDEMGYEGNIPYPWGNLSGFEMVNRIWKAVCFGGYGTHGETFMEDMNDEQTLWWSKGGKLKGQSEERIGFLKQILEEFPDVPVLQIPKEHTDIRSREELRKAIRDHVPGIADVPGWRAQLHDSDEDIARVSDMGIAPVISSGNRRYLKYFGDMCTIYGDMDLPEDHIYTIEVIDVWNMTREVVSRKASGRYHTVLPGKAGMAMLARLRENS